MRIAAAALFSACVAFGAQLEPKVTSLTLQNGMKILVEEDHDIPNVAMYLFYKVGSRNERPGITGISHYFEHMMFNGAKRFGPKQFDIEMEKNGGQNNAYTTEDVTVYTNWFPSTALRLMFDMESDRIRNLAFDPKIIESERGVVFSERQQSVDNNNFGLLSEQINAAAFTAHPYQWPVLGWASDIKAWSMQDLKSHFKMGYAPNNCVLVVVGDVQTSEVTKLAREFMEPIPRQDPPPPVTTVEPEQKGERRIRVVKPAQLPLQMIAFHIPETSHKDMAPLQVLQNILTQGRSSRLYKRMIDGDQLALSVNQSRQDTFDPSLLYFTIQPRAGIAPAQTEQALFEELEKLRNGPVSAAELAKAKNQFLTSFYRELQTIGGRANLLGTYEVFKGDYKRLYSEQSEIEAVTTADIMRIAKSYLGENNRTVATLVPEIKQ